MEPEIGLVFLFFLCRAEQHPFAGDRLLRGLVNLTLSNAGAVGQLPVELASLPFLRFLNISNNSFSGEFPDAGPDSFPALEFIDAYNNKPDRPSPVGSGDGAMAPAGGELYSEIKNLEYLGVNGNSLTVAGTTL